jgi:hypothetical protein
MGDLGLEVNSAKSIEPTTSLQWIGVLFDSVNMVMKIPDTVLTDTKTLVTDWLGKNNATRHHLQKLLGKLFHAAKCSPPDRLFVGRMLHTLRAAPTQGTISLPPGFRQDLDWFATFLPSYNGIHFIIPLRPKIHLQVLSSPTHLKAVWGDKEVVDALPSILNFPPVLAFKEVFTVFVALLLWGTEWAGKEVHIHTTAPKKLEILVHGKSRDLNLLHLARGIWLTTAQCDITLKPCSPLWGVSQVNNCEKWAVPQVAIELLHKLS